MRVDVDFNERDRQGHVVARVPGGQASRLTPGRSVYLYDPIERLWAEASVARINSDTRIAAFDVDWRSVTDAEVADVRDAHTQWFLGVPPTEGHRLPAVVYLQNCSMPAVVSWRVTSFNMGGHTENLTAGGTGSPWCETAAGFQGARP